MKIVIAAILCCAIAATQAVDWNDVNLIETPMLQFTEKPTGKITGGVEVTPNALPYQVGIFIEMSAGIAFCGGSVISKEWILTAAHCAKPGTHFEVVLGAHYVKNASEATQVHRNTTNKFVHPKWSRFTLLNDIALLHLDEPIVFNNVIQPIRLPRKSDAVATGDFVGVEALMSGWGKQTDESTAISDTLQAINKTVIDYETCEKRYFGNLDAEAHLCTSGTNGQSTCNGDSGGPLVYREADGKASQIGAVSFGIAFGCEVGWPPVFTRITSYLTWIEQTTGLVIRP